MQSTNCTAYIAPEVGMSALVNRSFTVLPCYCLSPHCKTGATQSIFLAECPLRWQPQEGFSGVHLPPTLPTYIWPKSPLLSHVRDGVRLFHNLFLYFLHLCRLGAHRSVQWICYNVLLASSSPACILSLPRLTCTTAVLDAQFFNQSRSLHTHWFPSTKKETVTRTHLNLLLLLRLRLSTLSEKKEQGHRTCPKYSYF